MVLSSRSEPAGLRVSVASAVFTLVGALTLLLAACGSSNTSSSTTTTPTTALNQTTATQQVTSAYATLFNLANPTVDSKVAVIQNGNSLKTGLSKELNSQLAKMATGATVSAVTFPTASQCQAAGLPHPCAKVTYSILGTNGSALIANNTGYAVYENGKWVVAKVTICSLLTLGNNNVPLQGC